MEIFKTDINGLIVITPRIFKDARGCFFESYNKELFSKLGIFDDFVQDNQSFSIYGTIRGLHFQKPPFAQSKLVRAIKGKVYDVAVDLRKDSATFGKWFGVELSEENAKMVYLPKGFAHGFSVLSDTAIFSYKCDNFYNKASEDGINCLSKDLKIDWQIPSGKEIISDKDKQYSSFERYGGTTWF
jgi:dTDP-4-dehydrorhamnose 3,5-epimerase